MSRELRILIVYASQSGGTQRMVEAVARGLNAEPPVDVRMLHGTVASTEDLLWCDGLVIGTPENFGYMAGAVKDFFDRTFYPALGLVDGLPYVLVVKGGQDGTFAASHVERIVRGYPLRRIAEPIVVCGDLSESDETRCEELGQMLAAGLRMGLFGRLFGHAKAGAEPSDSE